MKRHINPDGNVGGWVADTATVASSVYIGLSARVSGDAWVTGYARVLESARGSGNVLGIWL